MSAVNGLYTNFYIFSSDLLKAVGGGLFLRSVPGFEDVPAVYVPAYKAEILVFPLKI